MLVVVVVGTSLVPQTLAIVVEMAVIVITITAAVVVTLAHLG
jgi:hypothetical protein